MCAKLLIIRDTAPSLSKLSRETKLGQNIKTTIFNNFCLKNNPQMSKIEKVIWKDSDFDQV